MTHAAQFDSRLNELPPRTWRGWWLAWPKWFRIGCWAALIQAAVFATWFAYRWKGSQDIANLCRRGATVKFFWEDDWLFRLPYHHDTVYATVFGRSWPSVEEINLDPGAADADVLLIANHARSLEKLSLGNADISAAVIGRLANCRQLRELDLRYTDADDAAVIKLAACKELTSLYLTGTLVSDAAAPVLKELPRLAWVDVQNTDVSAEAIRNWQTERSDLKPAISTERDQHPAPVLASIRWSDGVRSSNFSGTFELVVVGPLESNSPRTARKIGANLDRRLLWWRNAKFTARGDGDYRFTLKLGNHEAEPVIVSVRDRMAKPDRIEFVMPCTKAEAMDSVTE